MSTPNTDSADATAAAGGPFSGYVAPTTPQLGRHAQVAEPVSGAPTFVIPPPPTEWPPRPQSSTPPAYTAPPATANPYAPSASAGYPQQGYPQQSYPQPGYPQPGYPPPAYPQHGYPPPPGQWPGAVAYSPAPSRRRLHPALVLVLVLALLGGGGYAIKAFVLDHKSTKSTASSYKPPAGSANQAPLSDAELTNVVLFPTDVPTGYTAQTDDSASSDDLGDDGASLFACLGLPAISDADVVGSASSNFGLGDSSTISSQATSFTTTADVATVAAMYTSPKASQCVQADFVAGVKADAPANVNASVQNISIKVSGRLAGQPANVIGNVQLSATPTANGQALPVYYFDSVIFGGAHTESEVDVYNYGTPVDPTLLTSLTNKMSAKVKG